MRKHRSDTERLWQGVRMRRCLAAADPDQEPRPVRLPASWDDAAARCVVAMAEDDGVADLSLLADRWLAPLAREGGFDLAVRAHALLLCREAVPLDWRREGAGAGLLLNVAAFGGDVGALFDAAESCVAIAAAIATTPGSAALALTGLAGLLAAAGLAYGTAEARGFAVRLARDLRKRCGTLRLIVQPPSPLDGLLGVETAGIAPAFSALDETGGLSRTARAYLIARGMSAETALAEQIAGNAPLPPADGADFAAMHAALKPVLDDVPALPGHIRRFGLTDVRPALPGRRGGTAQKAVVGGHRVYVRTGEYGDGRLGEVTLALPQASPPVRAMADALAHAVSLGLQHGVPLADFVDMLIGTRFSPAGEVEGDPAVEAASSPLDYLARHLATAYLPGYALPPPEVEHEAGLAPTLPLDLPPSIKRRGGLRVVK